MKGLHLVLVPHNLEWVDVVTWRPSLLAAWELLLLVEGHSERPDSLGLKGDSSQATSVDWALHELVQ